MACVGSATAPQHVHVGEVPSDLEILASEVLWILIVKCGGIVQLGVALA